ncbi:MAG: energy-coupled thiamine transporter ThiT [Clostridia bacterium]|nr:energy-coupled thiamine transporter ThiT [Clostridia bacterium]
MLSASKFEQYFFNFKSTTTTAISVMLWIFFALLICFVVLSLTMKDKSKVINKVFAILGTLYVATAIVLFAVLKGIENNEDGGVNALILYPMITLAIVLIASALIAVFVPNKIVRILSYALSGGALVAVIVCLSVYYASGEASEFNWIDQENVNSVALWITSVVLILVIGGLTFLDRRKLKFDTKSLTYAGITLALAFALSYIRIIRMPMGGGITLASLLPIMLYSYMFGTKKGVLVGVLYGVLQAIQDPWILHPAQFLLDYPVAFAGVGLVGLMRDQKREWDPKLSFAVGAIVAAFARLLAHFLSGAFAFGVYAGDWNMTSPYLYSIAYNAAYVLPDAALAIIAGILLMLSKTFTGLVLKTEDKPIDNTATISQGEE